MGMNFKVRAAESFDRPHSRQQKQVMKHSFQDSLTTMTF